MKFNTVNVPHVNVNDVEVILLEWHKNSWDKVTKGEVLCTIETTKAIVDIESEYDGYIYLVKSEGDVVKVGGPIAHILENKDKSIIDSIENKTKSDNGSKVVTKSAKELMLEHGLVIDDFEDYSIIQSDTVIAYLREMDKTTTESSTYDSKVIGSIKFTDNSVVLYCAVNHALLALDAFLSNNQFVPVLILMDQVEFDTFHGIPVIAVRSFSLLRGNSLENIYYREDGTNNLETVKKFCDSEGIKRVSAVHSDSSISSLSSIGEGVFIGANAIIGPEVKVGNSVQILAGASVAHHSLIGDFVTIADGTYIGGNVKIGNCTNVGIGVSINRRVTIGHHCTIVSGAIVIDHLLDKTTLRIN